MLEQSIKHKDLSIGFAVSLATGLVCVMAGMEILSVGAFMASALYVAKLYLREQEQEKPAQQPPSPPQEPRLP